MDRRKPEMRNRVLQHEIERRAGIEPVEKGKHFGIKAVGWGSLEMHLLPHVGVGNNLHWPGSPGSSRDLREAASASWEERGMPTEEPLISQGLIVVEHGVEHHLDNAIDLAVCRSTFAYIDAEPPGDGGSHFYLIEMLAFDRAGFEHVLGEGEKRGLFRQSKSE